MIFGSVNIDLGSAAAATSRNDLVHGVAYPATATHLEDCNALCEHQGSKCTAVFYDDTTNECFLRPHGEHPQSSEDSGFTYCDAAAAVSKDVLRGAVKTGSGTADMRSTVFEESFEGDAAEASLGTASALASSSATAARSAVAGLTTTTPPLRTDRR